MTPRFVRRLLIVAALGLALTACSGGDGDARTPIAGFGEVAFRVDDGAKRCALLAESDEQQARGLMGRTTLGGYDGMLFRSPVDTTGSFHMQNTPMPLSIAWFDADGRFVSAADMEPCLDRVDCPAYWPNGPYRDALEVPQGDLAELGIGPGSRLEVGGACP